MVKIFLFKTIFLDSSYLLLLPSLQLRDGREKVHRTHFQASQHQESIIYRDHWVIPVVKGKLDLFSLP